MIKYILELTADEEEARGMLLDNGVPEEEVNEQEIDHTINNLNDMTVDDFHYSFPLLVSAKGYKVGYGRVGYWMIFEGTSNDTIFKNSLVAEVRTGYTARNDLEITVDTSNSVSNLTEGIHEVLLELTTSKLS